GSDLHHAAHATHAAHAAAHAAGCGAGVGLVLGLVGDDGFGGDRHGRHRGGVLQGRTRDLGRVQDAEFDHVAEFARRGVVAEVVLAFEHLVQHHAGFFAGVADDFTHRCFQRLAGDGDVVSMVVVVTLQAFDRLQGTNQGHAAAGHHAFFDSCTGGVQGIFDARLLLLHFDFGGSADLDDGHAAGQLGHAFLQLLAVVVGGGLLDLRLDLLDARLDLVALAGTIDDGGVFLGDGDALGATQVVHGGFFKLQADFLGDHLAGGQDGHVFQHRLATIAEARGLDGGDLDDAADGVDHQRGQRLAFHVLGDDQQRLAGLGDALEHRQQVTHVGDLLVVQQDVRIFQLDLLALLVVDEVRRQVAAVELHALDDVQLVFQRLAFLDRDHAFLADLLHGLGDDVADVGIGVGGDGADLGDGLVVLGRVGQVGQLADGGDHGLVDAALEVHRVHAGGDRLHALADERLRQHGGGGGAVTGNVGGLGSGFLDVLRAQVLELVGQLDFLGHGHA